MFLEQARTSFMCLVTGTDCSRARSVTHCVCHTVQHAGDSHHPTKYRGKVHLAPLANQKSSLTLLTNRVLGTKTVWATQSSCTLKGEIINIQF